MGPCFYFMRNLGRLFPGWALIVLAICLGGPTKLIILFYFLVLLYIIFLNYYFIQFVLLSFLSVVVLHSVDCKEGDKQLNS